MPYVYILRSKKIASKFYVGITDNLERRLTEHANPDNDQYTKRYAPWEIEAYLVFKDRLLASKFEEYLKTGSGRVFMRRHLIK